MPVTSPAASPLQEFYESPGVRSAPAWTAPSARPGC